MRYKLFGASGLRVSELCLGALTFGQQGGMGADKADSREVFEAYVERGGNFIDVANKYNNGQSEEFLGEFMAGRRDSLVLATKFSLAMQPGDPNSGGNHRKCIMQSVEASLRRLKTDYIDLYWLHQWDFTTPVEETMRALDDLVRSGKVLYLGISDAPAWIAAQANTLAQLRGWTPFVGLQIEYSLIERTPERELLPLAQAFGLALALWGVVGGGVLTGKYHQAADPAAPEDTRRAAINATRLTERNLNIARTVAQVARELGKPPGQVALNWVRGRGPLMLPIVGARTRTQLEENMACLEFTLPPEALRTLDAASHIDLGFPHEFLARERIQEQRFGGTQHQLDNHHPLHHLKAAGLF